MLLFYYTESRLVWIKKPHSVRSETKTRPRKADVYFKKEKEMSHREYSAAAAAPAVTASLWDSTSSHQTPSPSWFNCNVVHFRHEHNHRCLMAAVFSVSSPLFVRHVALNADGLLQKRRQRRQLAACTMANVREWQRQVVRIPSGLAVKFPEPLTLTPTFNMTPKKILFS